MTGAYHIAVSNRYLKYEFTIKRNITVIKGNSATGKTTLIEMIREYNEEEDSGIVLNCDKKCVVLSGKNWESQLKEISDAIIFIDESGRFTKSVDFANAIRGTDNYYVIVSREKLSNLPFSIREIYGIRSSEKYMGIQPEYTLNEFYNIYGAVPQRELLIEETLNTKMQYSKADLNPYYISKRNRKLILEQIPENIGLGANSV